MFLEQVDIVRFRGIRQLTINLGRTTVLIGENNTGKSTILDAIRLALDGTATNDRARFTEHDHHLAASESQASDGTIEIVLCFSEQSSGEWPNSIIQKLGDVIQYDAKTGRNSVILRVQSSYDTTRNESVSKWDFLNLARIPLGENMLGYKKTLQTLIPVFHLKSKRDSNYEFKPNSALWGPFVQTLSMDPNVMHSLESELASLNQKIIDAHKSFSAVKEHLQDIAKLVPLSSDPVNIKALPNKVLDVLSKTEVSLSSITGARIPIGRHGEGTQSLAIICLFVAFLKNKFDSQDSGHISPILTLEEPEAHLHPSATHSVISLLEDQRGQNIIATHSGDLVSSVKAPDLRRLYRKDGEIRIRQADWDGFSKDEKNEIDRQIKTVRGNILFARCWLLVEGKTERIVFERCAAICGVDLAHEGVYCVEYSQIKSKSQALIKFAKQIGTEWFIVADGDGEGSRSVKNAEDELCGEGKESHICQLEHDTLDMVLCMEGFGHHYEQIIDPNHSKQTRNDDKQHWKYVTSHKRQSKSTAAASAVDEMCEKGKSSVPDIICQIITRSLPNQSSLPREA